MSHFLVGFFLLCMALAPADRLLAEVLLAPKQLIIVKPGIDRLHGSWIAAVINKGDKPDNFRLPVLLPRESIDFQPVEGLSPSEVKLEDDGVYVEKVFQPGVNVLSFAFVVAGSQGRVDLNFAAKGDLGELSVMTPRGMLQIFGQEFVDGGTDVQDLQMYNILVSKRSLMRGDEVRVSVRGIPEGRQRLWFVGLGFAALLLGAAIFLTWRSQRVSKLMPASDSVERTI